MSIFTAFYGGLHNFFSLWILCLFQVVPFLYAYVLASSLMEMGEDCWKDKVIDTLLILTFCFSGFGFFYFALEASTTGLASFLFQYRSFLLQIGGVILLLTGFYFLGVLKIPEPYKKPAQLIGGLLVGSILGLAYQPCVTPTLGKILNLINDPSAFTSGFFYLFFYTLGLLAALTMVGLALLFLVSRKKCIALRSLFIKIFGLTMLFIAALILLQKMTVYKSFLVGM